MAQNYQGAGIGKMKSCQIENLGEMDCDSTCVMRLKNMVLRFLVKVRKALAVPRNLRALKSNPSGHPSGQSRVKSTRTGGFESRVCDAPDLLAGDVVRVRSKDQIAKTLDNYNKLEGCLFLDEMWQHCGKKYRVFKKVGLFYDEAERKMMKSRNMVLLEGVFCSGRIPLYKEKCDRSCFLFWKEDWLEKCE